MHHFLEFVAVVGQIERLADVVGAGPPETVDRVLQRLHDLRTDDGVVGMGDGFVDLLDGVFQVRLGEGHEKAVDPMHALRAEGAGWRAPRLPNSIWASAASMPTVSTNCGTTMRSSSRLTS